MDKRRPTLSMNILAEGLVVHAFLLGWALVCIAAAWDEWTANRSLTPMLILILAGLTIPAVGLCDWWARRHR